MHATKSSLAVLFLPLCLADIVENGLADSRGSGLEVSSHVRSRNCARALRYRTMHRFSTLSPVYLHSAIPLCPRMPSETGSPIVGERSVLGVRAAGIASREDAGIFPFSRRGARAKVHSVNSDGCSRGFVQGGTCRGNENEGVAKQALVSGLAGGGEKRRGRIGKERGKDSFDSCASWRNQRRVFEPTCT